MRSLLIREIGYHKICLELNAITLDNYREYSLIRIDNLTDLGVDEYEEQEEEVILLLKMTCPSTGHLHVLRVPPETTSARDAITWINWGINPEDFVIEA